MVKVSGLPLGFETVGVKLYTLPATTLVGGVPEIVGGTGFVAGGVVDVVEGGVVVVVAGGVVDVVVDVVVGGGVVDGAEFCVTAAEVPPQPARAPIMRALTANSLAIPTSAACRRIKLFMWSRFNIRVRFLLR
jgi:hypothetical protein